MQVFSIASEGQYYMKKYKKKKSILFESFHTR